ncbi:hypothetical protein BDB00DRAFT_876756 [Zychaea mexicana]|uniref:uncharacterized protein n=1 Tax=Zychaea mexicana TaxID=64656 RepID=UPI0022FDBF21|nr:uncharacterized protein BDB00DRAFT_876756 [Zychaea mexicana]KAI9489087.1 hypothetical protein BDB00DRAFT_876756 [Zychaea mexicana]
MILKDLTSAWARGHVPSSLVLAIVAGAGALAYYRLQKSDDEDINYEILNTIPTPKGMKPYVGHLLCFDKLTGYKFRDWHQELGPVIRVQLGVQPCILISDPQIAHELFAVNGAVASNRPRFPNINRYYSNGKRGLVFQNDTTNRNHMIASAKAKSTSNTAVAQHYTFI